VADSVRGIWRTPVPDGSCIRSWADSYAVYNPLSGHTHFLDIVSGEILVELTLRLQSTDALCIRVADSLGMPLDEAIASQVRQLLVQLDEIGLIESTA
jgi:PqqD family protein of HPr-rel-A system